MAKFLQVELSLGLTFATIALAAVHNPEKRERNRVNAYKAFNAVVSLKNRIDLAVDEAGQFSSNLERLKTALDRLDATA